MLRLLHRRQLLRFLPRVAPTPASVNTTVHIQGIPRCTIATSARYFSDVGTADTAATASAAPSSAATAAPPAPAPAIQLWPMPIECYDPIGGFCKHLPANAPAYHRGGMLLLVDDDSTLDHVDQSEVGSRLL
jgi:hypothetical protein